jgi:hypothetical protein
MDSLPQSTMKLFLVKVLHTFIWAFFVSIIGFIVYAGIWNRLSSWVWIAVGLIIAEGIVLLLNKGKCPLTPIAAQFTNNREDNFDIFLPRWLARYNKIIFTVIYFLGVVLVMYRALT